MNCNDKEQKTCNVEKMGCQYCCHNERPVVLQEMFSKCETCLFSACETCEYTWSDIQKIKKYVEYLEEKVGNPYVDIN